METTASPIKWSFSGLKTYENCPKKYYHLKIAKDVQDSPGETALYGTAVHLAAEEYVRDGKPLPPQFGFMKPQLDALVAVPGEKLCEYEMGLREDLSPCGFNDEDYFCRGIADLIILDREKGKAVIVDYKTGSPKYADTGQLDLMAFMLFKHFPEINSIKAGLLFSVTKDFIKVKYKRDELVVLPAKFVETLAKLKNSMQSGVFNAKSSGLCGWCPVESCKHWRPRYR
jgi:hypothetical protein